MGRMLIIKEKKEEVEGRVHTTIKEKYHYVADLNQDFSTQYGKISKEDLSRPSGSVLKSDTGKEFYIFDAEFSDLYKRLRKLPQTIPPKDIGLIIAETGICRDGVIVDGGAGSGALAASLARIAKQVTSYEVREEHIGATRKNLKMLGIENVKLKQKSLYDGIDEKEVDLITLDLPEPWKVIPHAIKALKVGGWLVSYSPSIPQVQDFVSAVRKEQSLLLLKTSEIIERQWEVQDRKVRPESTSIGHSGFLTFVRKIKA